MRRRPSDSTSERISPQTPGEPEHVTLWTSSSPEALLSARYPIVFLPIRIETRFDPLQPNLLVRIYPDDLEIDSHEPPLTEEELVAGLAFQVQKQTDGEREAWRKLLLSYSPTRAAWIVNATFSSDDGDFRLFPPIRPSSWSSPAVTRVMPDRFIVRAYRGGSLIVEVFGNAVPDPLPVSFDPLADPDTDPAKFVDVSGNGLLIDRDVSWTLDFDAAVGVGMAMRVPLQPADATSGFDQLIVAGVKGLLPGDATQRLEQLFHAHHYTRGFAFVPQGTATTNTSEAHTTVPQSDPGGAHSFAVERDVPLNVAGGNGRAFTSALGFDERLTEHVEHAGLLDEPHARAFNTALFPGTLGYYIRQMLHPMFRTIPSIDLPDARFTFRETIDWEVRAHFIDHVRGGAALPPIRIGNTVYGVLPVTSLARWQGGNGTLENELPKLLQRLVTTWSANLAAVPRLGRGSDADADLLATAGMDARSHSARIRWMLGPTANFNLLSFLDLSADAWNAAHLTIGGAALSTLGRAGRDALIAWMSFGKNADRFAHALVADAPSELDALTPNYINWIRNASVDSLRRGSFGGTMPQPVALLYHLLRYATLTEYDRLAMLMLSGAAESLGATLLDRPDAELIAFDEQFVVEPPSPSDPTPLPSPIPIEARATSPRGSFNAPVQTAWDRLGSRTEATGTQTIAEFLLDPARAGDGLGAQSYRAALAAIEELPTAELERLFMSTLDTCSHRLDAWITSLASKRLRTMRRKTATGSHLGSYGWVEDLRPVNFTIETIPDGRTAVVQPDNAGYVQAPTMTHASAAAVLRNAHFTRSGGDSNRYAVDLSSDRVRRAMRILDDVRCGESLGSALGRQFESGVRDRNLAAKGRFAIEQFRHAYPLVANKLADSQQPAELVAARNVVDGLRLLTAFREETIAFDEAVLPAGSDSRVAVESELAAVGDSVDAISDLLFTESIFQTMRGNTTATAATLETISRGVRPPELECVQQPRGGTTLTHRVAILLGGTAPATPLWIAPGTPRALAEPRLDAWYAELLGDPNTIRCRVAIPNPSLPRDLILEVSLADLSLRPIDFVALAGNGDSAQSELDQRLAFAVQSPEVAIDHAPWSDRTIRSFPEAIDLARALRELVATSRPLKAVDLLTPQTIADAQSHALNYGTRHTAAFGSMQQVRNALIAAGSNLFSLRTALDGASLFGVEGAFSPMPIAFSTLDDLSARRDNTLVEINRRIAAFGGKPPDEAARVLFGADFVLLPEFTPPRATELGQALAAAPSLVASDPMAVTAWLRKAAIVREPLARLRKLTTLANAFSGAVAKYDVAQLPVTAGAAWVALPFADEAHRPPAGRVSIVLQRVATPSATVNWCGLMLDEWSETIPSSAEQTGVAAEYENRHAEAPKAVLVAVPSVEGELWLVEDIFDCLRETLHLAKVRANDLETLGDVGQLVPAICLASNVQNDTISAALSSLLTIPQPRRRVVTEEA